jgi:hypothetical protein
MFARRDRRTSRGRAGGAIEIVPSVNPLTVAGLTLDLNMRNVGSYTVTGGNTVTSIVNTVSAVSYDEPTLPPGYEAAGLNGYPCLVGDGVDDRIMSTEAAVLTALGSASVAAFYVVKWGMADAQAWILGGARSAVDTAVGHRMFGQTVAGPGAHAVLERSGAGVSGNQIASVTPQTAAAEVVCHRIDGAVWTLLLDGIKSSEASHPAQTIAPTRVGILCRPDLTPDGFAAVRCGRILLISPAPTLFVCRGISKHLKAEWGIA